MKPADDKTAPIDSIEPADPTSSSSGPSRRSFLQAVAILGVGGRTLFRTGDARGAVYAAKTSAGSNIQWPDLGRRKLGRTGFEASRLVFGCGAALSRGRKDDLLEAAFDAGINTFDNGSRRYYNDAEVNLAPFLARHKQDREKIFLISKAMTYLEVEPNAEITLKQAKQAAATWSELMEQSLRELGVDFVDAYYVMGSYNPYIVGSEEIRRVFERARDAGKVKYMGLSTHQNAQRVLEAAMETGWYDLAQVAITPAGWYDFTDRSILPDSPPLKEITPFLNRVRDSGIGLIGMKAGRYLAGRKFLGWGKPDAFDEYYDAAFMSSGLSPFQRSYAYVLAHGLDAVNADMQSFAHLEENVAAAASSPGHFA
jgi:aryl-alcohol dehydrogenase-like predicted oxidoreductase